MCVFFSFVSFLTLRVKEVLFVLVGGEPVLGGALLIGIFYLFPFVRFLCCCVFYQVVPVASHPRGHDSETTTAVDEVGKTRLAKEGRRWQAEYY